MKIRLLAAIYLLMGSAISYAQQTALEILTSEGPISVVLHDDKSPVSVANFLAHVDESFYNNTVFHRVIKNFMIQGGGFVSQDGKLIKKPNKAPIKNESDNGLQNKRGTLSMARLNNPDSATSQFFINLVDNTHLDAKGKSLGYSVFGEITEGLEIIDTIAAVKTGRSGNNYTDVPQKPITIIKITRIEKEAPVQ